VLRLSGIYCNTVNVYAGEIGIHVYGIGNRTLCLEQDSEYDLQQCIGFRYRYNIDHKKAVFSSSRALMQAYGDTMSTVNDANSGNISSNYLCDTAIKR